MANISVSYTFTNGTTADASQVNQNFTDIINGTSDGTKDFSINALTVAGAASLNGNVTLGNASADDITFNGSIASNIPIKTTASYAIGTTSVGLSAIYFGDNSQVVGILPSASMSATYNLTLPVNAGTQGYVPQNSGSGVLAWKPGQSDTSAKSANYTITDSDGIRTVLMTTSTSDRTVTLPTAADNSGRIITIKKVDSAANKCIVDGEGAETIDGATTIDLFEQYDSVTVQCDGSAWHTIDTKLAPVIAKYTISSPADANLDNGTEDVIDFDNSVYDTHSAVSTGTAWTFTAPRAGYYEVSAFIRLATGTDWSESEYLRLYTNGSALSREEMSHRASKAAASGGHQRGGSGTTVVYLASGATVYVEGLQNSGSAKNISAGQVTIREVK